MTKIDGVDVHTTIVGPVVGEGHDQLDISLLSGLDNSIELLETSGSVVDGDTSILPFCEPSTGPVLKVLWQTVGVESGVSVVEAPCSHNLKANLSGSLQAGKVIGVVL